MLPEHERIIEKSSLFMQVDLDYIKKLSDENKLRFIQKDEFVFRQGDKGDSLFIILSGRLEVFIERSDRKSIPLSTIAELTSPSFFGEICLLCEQARTATVKAVEDSELLEISAENFQQHLKNNEMNAFRINYNISLMLVERLRKTIEMIKSLDKEIKQDSNWREIAHYKKRLLDEVLI